MDGFIIMALFVLAILIGQFTRYFVESKSAFYLIHFLGFIVVMGISIFISYNQSGGENWPWWIYTSIYTLPILLSLIIGIIQDILKREN